MVFNSITYVIFFAIVLLLYHNLRQRGQNLVLLAASYLFYGWWDIRLLFLIALSTTIDYWSGLIIHQGHLSPREKATPAAFLTLTGVFCLGVTYGGSWRQPEFGINAANLGYLAVGLAAFFLAGSVFYAFVVRQPEARRRKLMLIASIGQNLTILGFFKYFNFFISSAAAALQAIGFDAHPTVLHIVLPIGVSFYTFQSISYAVEVYQRKVVPSSKLSDFALFVSYFPQLVAGPINRATELLPQLLEPRKLTYEQITTGSYLILLGLFKKVGIADGLTRTVDQAYAINGTASWIDVLAGTFFFAVQIYCDFSGYTDIARGSSKLLGIELVVNFNTPYFAKDPQEFWRRWHISLSNWLRDYLYIPLGGSRGGPFMVYRNLMLTMVLGGLWHGAAWNFVLWGFYQGAILCVYRAVQGTGGRGVQPLAQGAGRMTANAMIRNVLSTAFFFGIVCYGWLLFRAGSLDQIQTLTGTLIFDAGNLDLGIAVPRLSSLLGLPILVVLDWFQFKSGDAYSHRRLPFVLRGLVFAAMATVMIMGMSNESAQFIYFQF